MPGAISIAPTKRSLHIFWIVDVSGSMNGAKIASLNEAIRQVLPDLKNAGSKHSTNVKVHAIAFGAGARHLVDPPQPLDTFVWNDIQACDNRTDLGAALAMATADLELIKNEKQNPPVLILITDGQPTDAWQTALPAFDAAAKKSIRLAIAIGDDADPATLCQVTGNPETVKTAQSAHEITPLIIWASKSGIGASLAPQAGGALPQPQVLPGGSGPQTFI